MRELEEKILVLVKEQLEKMNELNQKYINESTQKNYDELEAYVNTHKELITSGIFPEYVKNLSK